MRNSQGYQRAKSHMLAKNTGESVLRLERLPSTYCPCTDLGLIPSTCHSSSRGSNASDFQSTCTRMKVPSPDTCTHTHTPGPPRQTSFFTHQSLSNEKTSSSGARNEMARYAQKHVNCTMRVLNYKIPFFNFFLF